MSFPSFFLPLAPLSVSRVKLDVVCLQARHFPLLSLSCLLSAVVHFSYLGTRDPQCKATLSPDQPFPTPSSPPPWRKEVQAEAERWLLVVSGLLIRPPASSLVDGIPRPESVVLPGTGCHGRTRMTTASPACARMLTEYQLGLLCLRIDQKTRMARWMMSG